ncbi:thiamine pyrophosphate-dependent dehydrogenase E1 component subunit alpha [Gordonia aichiensis]|uniref:thiamine pyrophosphate-dependent dehydrogenase E1 component subunit alpha n=1 Tax=Gordonia aichiensis TaxID=36820 RepID=UPI003267C476
MADDVTREDALELMARMVRIRKFEELAARLRMKGLIPGFLHPYIGQEAVAVGVCAALGAGDVLTSTHRGHGHILGRGADPARMYAELFARATGYNSGKGGSLHMIDTDLGFLGANGIVAGGIPLATGAALQLKRTGSGDVAVTFFGDGASNEGAFHEAMNLAALWKLPVLFVCENNLYGEFTRQDKHQLITDVADRAASYVMPGVVVDGNDVLAVKDVTAEAVARARAGDGPTLIEAKTYRHHGHFEGDMARYRPKDEVAHWMSRDPIDLFAQVLTDRCGVSADEVDALKTEVVDELKRAAAWAEEQPFPNASEALTDIYVNDYEGAMLR